MIFMLDYKSRLPIYEQIYNCVVNIASLGAYEKDELLPSVRALATQLGVNPNTVQKAYQMLERDGIIASIPGKGSFISDENSALSAKKQQLMKEIKELLKQAKDYAIDENELTNLVSSVYKEENNDWNK